MEGQLKDTMKSFDKARRDARDAKDRFLAVKKKRYVLSSIDLRALTNSWMCLVMSDSFKPISISLRPLTRFTRP